MNSQTAGLMDIAERDLHSIFEKIYSGVLFMPRAIHTTECKAVEEGVLEFNDLPINTSVLSGWSGAELDPVSLSEFEDRNPVVTSKILRIVNSCYTESRVSLNSLQRVIRVIGKENVRGIALGISAFNAAGAMQLPSELKLDILWGHSLAVGHIGRIIARKLGDIDGATLLTGGILHDVGKLVMFSAFRERLTQSVVKCAEMQGELTELQLKAFGFTHPIVGAALLKVWGLPERLWGLIAAQEYTSMGHDLRTAACLKLAEFFARSYSIGADGQWAHAFVTDEMCWHLGLNHNDAETLVRPDEIRRVVETSESVTI